MSLLEPPQPQAPLPRLLVVVVALLLVWTPVSLALVAAGSWPRLARYGPPAWGLLAMRIVVAGLGMVAARWILERDPRGHATASACLLANAVTAIVAGLTPFFLSNAVPGTKWPSIAAVVALNLVLAAYTARLYVRVR